MAKMRWARSIALAVLAFSFPARAERPASEPVRPSYPGVIALEVDATDIDRRIYRVHETVPVQAGPLTLSFPQWLPGAHSPGIPIWQLAGLKVTGGGAEIPWQRDLVDVYAFSVQVPKGVSELRLEFQYLSALQPPFVVLADIVTVRWHSLVLYPAGVHSDGVRVRPAVKLPAGWEAATSLDVETKSADTLRFAPVSLTVLVDSPVWAGRFARRIELDKASAVTLDVFADQPENLAAEPEHVDAFRAMVAQTYKVFGAPNYQRYELLLGLHDQLGGFALEHQSSTEIRRPPGFFTKWKSMLAERTVFPHEFVHAWIGKKHRPAELATPHFNVPMKDSLLWSYEGETEYWANVLAARSGMLTKEEAQGQLARVAAALGVRAGRSWRNLQDTTNDPIMRADRSRDWFSWQRGVDYYGEGIFLWLETDARIRQLSGNKRSMDDFARTFHGGKSGVAGIVTYTFDDVVKALNEVAPDDWRAFLRERLDTKTRDNAAEALKAAGWRVVYKDKQNDYDEASDKEDGYSSFTYSLGFVVGKSDAIVAVLWESPAFHAGMTNGMTLLAVNGRAYKAELLKNAVTAAKESGAPITLLVKNGDLYKTAEISQKGGLRYPHLERIPDTPDLLTMVLEPLP